ncbi:MAG: DNA-binding protein [Bacteroidetes bacterium HGW-Bacteroidetes-13]|jgi:cold shock CspA family protein|nr:MAG: DNA-binding protein [Bacteroidetes bacterium HGW-Bacteroidetes-13]
MAKSQQSFGKKEKEKLRIKKRQDKELRKIDRKANAKGGGFENMIAYVDEYGQITDTPPDPSKKIIVDVESIEIGVPKRAKEEEVDPVKKGKIDYFNDSKGFGFIKENGTQEKYFVHASGMIDDLKEGEAVSFELERGMKGMNAVRVKRITTG